MLLTDKQERERGSSRMTRSHPKENNFPRFSSLQKYHGLGFFSKGCLNNETPLDKEPQT